MNDLASAKTSTDEAGTKTKWTCRCCANSFTTEAAYEEHLKVR